MFTSTICRSVYLAEDLQDISENPSLCLLMRTDPVCHQESPNEHLENLSLNSTPDTLNLNFSSVCFMKLLVPFPPVWWGRPSRGEEELGQWEADTDGHSLMAWVGAQHLSALCLPRIPPAAAVQRPWALHVQGSVWEVTLVSSHFL